MDSLHLSNLSLSSADAYSMDSTPKQSCSDSGDCFHINGKCFPTLKLGSNQSNDSGAAKKITQASCSLPKIEDHVCGQQSRKSTKSTAARTEAGSPIIEASKSYNDTVNFLKSKR